jgi:IclR family KDG regulon transcriptional repressor
MENENLARTVGKALDILDCLGREKICLSASEVARHCGLSRPTAYRLLNTLLNRGYVAQNRSQEEKYRLGYKILELSKSLLDSMELRQQALPFLQDLSRTINETVHLAVLDRDAVVYIEKVESNQAVRMHSTIGSRYPVHCTPWVRLSWPTCIQSNKLSSWIMPL